MIGLWKKKREKNQKFILSTDDIYVILKKKYMTYYDYIINMESLNNRAITNSMIEITKSELTKKNVWLYY